MGETKVLIHYSDTYEKQLLVYEDFMFIECVSKNVLWDEEICKLIVNNVENGTDVLDIGASIGLISLGISQLLKQTDKKINKIHCFEPDIRSFEMLKINLNDKTNVNFYPFALGDTFKMATMTNNNYNKGTNYIFETNENNLINNYMFDQSNCQNCFEKIHNTIIPIISLDSIDYLFINKVSVIKIDIEGYEFHFLMGAKNFIKNHKPIIIIEIAGCNNELVFNVLAEYGYNKHEKINNEIYSNNDYIFFPTP